METDEPFDWNYLTVQGKGVYVSDTLALFSRALLPHPNHWQKTAKVDYAVTTYRYAMDGATGNGELTPASVRVKVGDLTGWSAARQGE